jgi:hypothetical protein
VESRRVLVIDDEELVLDSVSRIPIGRNYQVDVSPSGRNGLRKAIEGGYDAEYLERPFTPEEVLKTVASALDTIFTREPEERDLIHREESIEVLERAASDNEFFTDLLEQAADALDEYDLTGPEKLAILTRDLS